MTSDASNLPEHIPTPPIEGRVAPPFDDPVAASLRGFGPLGLLAILLIFLTSVIQPLSALLVLLWAWRSHTPWREIGNQKRDQQCGLPALSGESDPHEEPHGCQREENPPYYKPDCK